MREYTGRGPMPGVEQEPYAEAMQAIMEVLQYPVGPDGTILGISDGLDLLKPTIAYHLARCGIGPGCNPPIIKKQNAAGPGRFDDACIWVPVTFPDDPLADLQSMTIGEINALPPHHRVEAFRRLGMPLPVPDQPEGWTATPNVNITDAPDEGP